MPTPTPSAVFTVNGSAVTGAVAVSASSTVTLALASTFGVSSVEWSVVGTSSDSLTAPTITSTGYPLGITASFPMPSGAGQSYLIQCKINSGRASGRVVAGYTARAIIGVVDGAGYIRYAVGEKLERSATHGWTQDLNEKLETVGTGITDGSVTTSKVADSAITAAKLDDNAGAYATMAALRSAVESLAIGRSVRTACHTTKAAGGGLEYTIVAVGSYVHNGGTIIVPTGSPTKAAVWTGAGHLTPEMFGPDEDAAFDAAITAIPAAGGTISLQLGKTYTLTQPIDAFARTAVRIVGNRAKLVFAIAGADVPRCIDARRSVDFSVTDLDIDSTGTDLAEDGAVFDLTGSDATAPMFRFSAYRVKSSLAGTGRHFYTAGSVGCILTDVATFGGKYAVWGRDAGVNEDFAHDMTCTNVISVGLTSGGWQFYNPGNNWVLINSFPTPDADHSPCWISQDADSSSFCLSVIGGTLNDETNDDRYWIDLPGQNIGVTIQSVTCYATFGGQLMRTTGTINGLSMYGCGLFGGTANVPGKEQIRMEGTNVAVHITGNYDGAAGGIWMSATTYNSTVGDNFLGDRMRYWTGDGSGPLDRETGVNVRSSAWGIYSLRERVLATFGRKVMVTNGDDGDPCEVFAFADDWYKVHAPGTLATPFDNTALADTVVLLDVSNAASRTMDGSNVAALADLSGSGNHVSQATAGARPLLVADDGNGNASIQCASGDFLQVGTFVGGSVSPNVIYIAGEWGTGGVLLDHGGVSPGREVLQHAGGPPRLIVYDGAVGGDLVDVTAVAAGTKFIAKVQWNVDLTVTVRIEYPYGFQTGGATMSQTGLNGLTIGAISSGGTPWDGKFKFLQIAETVSVDDDARMMRMLRDRFLFVTGE